MTTELRILAILAFGIALIAPGVAGGYFAVIGLENLTEPGFAHLLLDSDLQDEWENQTLRVEISGATYGVLQYQTIERTTDLGYFNLSAGNYTLSIYVLPELVPSVGASGSVTYQESIEFSVPEAPEPPEPDKPLIDPENLGFMITGLFVFGLILTIWRTTNRPATGPDDT